MIAGAFPVLSFAQPAVSLSQPEGPPTTSVSVSGSGFDAYTAVDIYFDTTDQALTTTDGSGSFSGIGIRVPTKALLGPHWVSAVERSNHRWQYLCDQFQQRYFVVEI